MNQEDIIRQLRGNPSASQVRLLLERCRERGTIPEPVRTVANEKWPALVLLVEGKLPKDDERTTDELIRQAEEIAAQEFDGHVTILKFTTHWKCAFGTPVLDGHEGRGQVLALKAFPTLREALVDLIARHPIF